ncbi:MAG: DOMON-like domain-containing protein [Caulobacteraceae bacterium]|nr:DOMON-like domain-containing protein [Caulobacteraceae bacterium]
MRLSLQPHPDWRSEAVAAVAVEIARPGADRLVLTYRLTGAIGRIALPPPASPARADELWKSTCFEAFLRPSEGEAYFEFNFAPSRRWAAYRFDGYRGGMTLAEVAAPVIEPQAAADGYALKAGLDLGALRGASPGARWRLGLSAVIEEVGGAKSYWALAHPPGKPDFHHACAFALDLAAGDFA